VAEISSSEVRVRASFVLFVNFVVKWLEQGDSLKLIKSEG